MDMERLMAQMRQAQRREILDRLVAEGLDPDLAARLFAIMEHSENHDVFTDAAFEDQTVLRDGFTVGDLRTVETAFTCLVNDVMVKTCEAAKAAEERGIPLSFAVNFDLMNERVAVLLQAWDNLHTLAAKIEVPDEVPESWL